MFPRWNLSQGLKIFLPAGGIWCAHYAVRRLEPVSNAQ